MPRSASTSSLWSSRRYRRVAERDRLIRRNSAKEAETGPPDLGGSGRMKLHRIKNALKLTLYRMGLLPSPWQMYSANKLIELEAVLSHLTPVSSGAILDVCCGSGIPTHSLAKRAPGAIGVDLDEDGLRSAEWHRTHSNARSRLRFVGGDAERLPFTDGSFPAVVSFCSIEHTSDPLKMAQEAWRVLRDGGEFVLTADSLGNVDPTFPREE